ncbi:heme A synthase [Bacterioplanes sanyensis]|uniref:COX15/CtaA family protein n=1 Tax=Bacterioplanes sanyensis TaxID=1249553 RepID=UPI00167A4DCF|nr:COX15/CtaA family protein [Bacterioplanes sanyensis]GGY35329.1 heme A synthase [Bacterioplanes sanyensis]
MTDSVRTIRSLALGGSVFCFVVVLVGVATRLMDAGLGCPDWPGCYGRLVVPDAETAARFSSQPLEPVKAWMEMIHRYLASSLGLLALVAVGLAWRIRRQQPSIFRWALALLLMMLLQGAFGAWTVTLQLWPQVVTAHLLGGLTCLSLFVALYWCCKRTEPSAAKLNLAARRSLRRRLALLLSVLVLQVALGGWTSSNYAGTGCVGFPTCNGEWWPAMDMSEGFHITQSIGPHYLYGQLHAEARTAIHFMHRLNAVLLGVVLLFAWHGARRCHSQAQRPLGVMMGLYALQIALAIILVTQGMPLWIALAHTAVAAGLLVLVLYAWRQAGRVYESQDCSLAMAEVTYE